MHLRTRPRCQNCPLETRQNGSSLWLKSQGMTWPKRDSLSMRSLERGPNSNTSYLGQKKITQQFFWFVPAKCRMPATGWRVTSYSWRKERANRMCVCTTRTKASWRNSIWASRSCSLSLVRRTIVSRFLARAALHGNLSSVYINN